MKYHSQNVTTVAGAWLTLLEIITLSASTWAQTLSDGLHNPTPYIDEILPTAAKVNGPGFILTLKGAGFRPGSEVGWQVGDTTRRLGAVLINSSELATWVPASFIGKAATVTATVINPDEPPLVGKSNPVFLPITVATSSVAFTQNNITLGSSPNSIVTADFNADGKLDLAVSEPCGSDPTCSTYNGDVAIFLGKGDGTFTAAALTAVDQYPGALAVGDLNGDGKLDLAVSNFDTGDVSILLGNGDGSFTAAASPTVGSQPAQVFLGDLNGDGKLDLVVGTSFAPYVSILLGNGRGTFTQTTSPSAPTSPLSIADVNRDGKLDLVFALGNSPAFAQSTISVLLGNGDGMFSAGPTSPVVDAGISGGVLADLHGHGRLDLAATVAYPSNSYYFLLGNEYGKFTVTNSMVVSNNGNGPAIVGDFNATINDVNGGTVSILLQETGP